MSKRKKTSTAPASSCRACGAGPGQSCVNIDGKKMRPHAGRAKGNEAPELLMKRFEV